MLNILEAFFRNPLLHLLPVVLLVALGLASLFGGTTTYRSTGSITVTDESLLADLTNAGQNDTASFESPAVRTARQMNEILGTMTFAESVVARENLQTMVDAGLVNPNELYTIVGAGAAGDNLVSVSAQTTNPEVSAALIRATVAAYREFLVDNYRKESSSTVTSLTSRLAEKQATLDGIDEEINLFLDEAPDTAVEDRSVRDQVEYERLTDNRARAAAQVTAAEDQLDQAELQNDQAEVVVDQRMALLDQPVVATAPEGRLKKAVLTVAVFGALGALLSLASVVIAATLDRSIRVPGDITGRFGVDVLAVIPNRGR